MIVVTVVGPSTLFRYENFSTRRRAGAQRPLVGPPHISETARGRKLKFYTHFDGAKYFLGVKIFPLDTAPPDQTPP